MVRKIACALLICAAVQGNAQTILQYAFPGGSIAPTSVDPNASASSMNSAGSNACVWQGAGPPIEALSFVSTNSTATTGAGAVAGNSYFQFTLTANPGYDLDLDLFTVQVTRSTAHLSAGYVVRTSVDNFAANISDRAMFPTYPTYETHGTILSGAQYQNLGSITLRFYPYAPVPEFAGMYFDNFTVNGAVTAVPEPATVVAIALGLTPLLRGRRCRATA